MELGLWGSVKSMKSIKDVGLDGLGEENIGGGGWCGVVWCGVR